ncbi:uncharacterized protein LOC118201381 [Stegodyphus dumicola]|uniref:uncharacterized protein LOC118201381 n=1 Tax=Stegodyphus dumicola TaxID=202533 RepID=UPI0015B15878|nr:uncharacterized protein LOC118201381 [Stegodyphus dumicola]
MFALFLPFVLSCAVAAPSGAPIYAGVGVLGPSYHAPVVPVAAVAQPKTAFSYTVTNVNSPTGAIKQQTAVGKDELGGHVIRHSAQATNVDPHSGQTDVKHDEHEFHINPFIGEAGVHTQNAEGSLNPTLGKAAFAQKSHEAKIAPGHTSVADVADTAAVSAFSSAASRDVNAARADVVHDGIAKNAHASHKSYVNTPGIGGHSQAAETNKRSFEGPGYGNLHYDAQSAKEAYDALGHASASENGYKLDQAYDLRVNLGASNELEYSRHAAHDPYGNYGAVTQTREASQGGQLVPVVHEQPAVYISEQVPAPVVVKEVAPAVPAPVVYSAPAQVTYQKEAYYKEPLVYDEHAYGYPHGGYYGHGY